MGTTKLILLNSLLQEIIKTKMASDWKQGMFGCFDDIGICCCGMCCNPCITYQTAEDLGKSGILYLLLGCVAPCIPALLLRQEARSRYNIDGETGDDVLMSFCCTACVTCQTSAEIKGRGDSSK